MIYLNQQHELQQLVCTCGDCFYILSMVLQFIALLQSQSCLLQLHVWNKVAGLPVEMSNKFSDSLVVIGCTTKDRNKVSVHIKPLESD